jgi:hypothetical protein
MRDFGMSAAWSILPISARPLRRAWPPPNRARQAALEGWWDSARKEDATGALGELEAQLDRLHVRLGKEEPIVKAYTTMGNLTHALNRLPPPAQQPTRDEVLRMPEIQPDVGPGLSPVPRPGARTRWLARQSRMKIETRT